MQQYACNACGNVHVDHQYFAVSTTWRSTIAVPSYIKHDLFAFELEEYKPSENLTIDVRQEACGWEVQYGSLD
jgi:hypothetical protein